LQGIGKISSVPAVIFTAYEGLIDLQAMKKLGSCEVMVKTVDLHMLGHIVNGVMAVKKLQNSEWVERGNSQA
jgi:hypothetical protein